MTEIDPFAFEDDDEDDSKEVAAVIKERNRLGKLLRDRDKEIERLRPFEVQTLASQRDDTLTGIFKDSGLNPKHVKLFSALNPEVTAAQVTKEQVLAFATENELPVSAPTEPEGTAVPPEGGASATDQGFAPVTVGNAQAPGKITREAWSKLVAADPAQAQQLYLDGQVDMSEIEALKTFPSDR